MAVLADINLILFRKMSALDKLHCISRIEVKSLVFVLSIAEIHVVFSGCGKMLACVIKDTVKTLAYIHVVTCYDIGSIL